jgi:hypothetical protein
MKITRKHHGFLFSLLIWLYEGEGRCIIHAYDLINIGLSGPYRIDIEVFQSLNGKRRVIFPLGQLYVMTPACGGMSLDGLRAKELVMSCVGMKPGDTDKEYLADYSQEQLEWAYRYGDILGVERERRYCNPKTGACR